MTASQDTPRKRTLIGRVRHAHVQAMTALAADIPAYSGSAIREWEAELDAALSALAAEREQLTEALREALAMLADTTAIDPHCEGAKNALGWFHKRDALVASLAAGQKETGP